ncbi:MAG TPA: enoyl-CoA hydratase-related protein, partial [Burkholderiaceae bacterium]
MSSEHVFGYQHLLVRVAGSVAHATLNRPDALNALNAALVAELHHFFGVLQARPEIRVVVMDAAGRAFCAGADLKERPLTDAPRSVAD